MDVKFSVSRASPAGPVIVADVAYGLFTQRITLTPEKARDLYRSLGDALLALDRAPSARPLVTPAGTVHGQ